MTRRVKALALVLGGVLVFAAGLSGLVVQAIRWEGDHQGPGFWEVFGTVAGMVSGMAVLVLAGICAITILEDG